jgi:hypothetical protein
LAVSSVDPVSVEIATGFRLFLGFELADARGLTVGQTIGVGAPLVMLPFGSLAYRPKIDQFSHSRFHR